MSGPRPLAPLTSGQRDALRTTLVAARALPLYAGALAHVAPMADPAQTLASMPVFDPGQVAALARQVIERRAHDLGGIEMTSGTTGGQPKRRILSEEDVSLDAALVAELLHVAGVRPTDRVVAVELAATTLSSAFLEGAERLGARFAVALAAVTPADASALLRLKPDAVTGPPSVLTRLLPALLACRPRLVIYNGDRLAASTVSALCRAGIGVRSLYGLTETSALGVECAAQAGVHLCPRFALYETRAVAGGRELLVSTLGYAMPLLRYPTGDLVRVERGPCPCGRSWPRITITGRTGDQFSLFDVKLTPDDIAAALPPSADPFLQVVLTTNPDGSERLTLRLPRTRAGQRTAITRALRRYPLLDYLITTHAVQVRIAFVTPPGGRKPPRLVDRRQERRE